MQAVIRQFPLAVGLSEGDDPKTLPPGALLSLINAVWRKTNRIEKRYGTAGYTKSIVGGGTLGAAARLVVRGSELALTNGTNLYSYTASGWVDRGRHPEIGLEWSTSTDSISGAMAADLAMLSNGLVVEAWVSGDPAAPATNGSIYYQIRDTVSGVVVTAPTKLDTAVWPTTLRIIASGTTWVILWMTTAGVLKRATSTGSATLKSDATVNSNSAADACVIGTDFVVAYTLLAGGIRLVRYSIATTPVEATNQTVTGETTTSINSIGISGAAGETLYITYVRNALADFRFAAANPSTLVQTVAPSSFDTFSFDASGTITVARQTSTSCVVMYSYWTTSLASGVTKRLTISNAGALSSGQNTYFTRLVSRPFLMGGRFYAVLATDVQATTFTGVNAVNTSETFLADVTDPGTTTSEPFRQVGKIDAFIGGCWARGYVCTPSVVSSTVTALSVGYQSSPSTGITGVRQGIRYVRCSTGASLPADMWRPLELGGEAYLAAGVFTAYDGLQAIGYGWPSAPYLDDANMSVSASGGNLLSGNYTYNITAERRSAAGMLHRSPVGIPITKTVTGPTGKVVVAIVESSLGHASLIPGEFIIYRTVANGTTLQRLGFEPSFMLFVDSGLTAPTTANDVVDDNGNGLSTAFVLAKRPALYTAGGELEDWQPVAFLTATLHRNRIFGLAGDKRTVWVSKDYSGNPNVAPGFHPTQLLTFPEDMVSLASMDDKLIALGTTKPYYVLGDGPLATGEQSDYGSPTPIQSDVGCSNTRSVVGTPDGLMFLTVRGFYLLSRGLELVYVGKAVEDTIAAFPNVTSAVLVAKYNQVRWTANNAAGTAGRVIVFDYKTKQWSVFSYWDADASVSGTPIADAVLWNSVYTFVTPAGKLYTEDATTYLDNGTTWVPQSGALAWLGEGGPLGFQHIRRAFLLGDKYTDCDFTLQFGFNHSASYAQAYTWVSDKLTQFGDGVNVGMRVGSQNGASPRCRAFRVAWQDAAPTGAGAVPGTGQGFNLSAIGIEFIPKPDMDRRSARART